jgi:hypothetical protein
VPPVTRITVANLGDAAVSDVRVEAAGAEIFRASSVRAGGQVPPEPLRGAWPGALTVRWRTAAGEAAERAGVPVAPRPRRFSGTISVRITPGGGALVELQDERGHESDLPWAERKPWEGMIPVPGMSP